MSDFWHHNFYTLNVEPRTLYKITNSKYCTRHGTRWGTGVTNKAPGFVMGTGDSILIEPSICSSRWVHAYIHPIIAVFFNRIHVAQSNFVLWACRGDAKVLTPEGKVGCTSLTTEYIVPTPVLTNKTRITIGAMALAKVYDDRAFREWVRSWQDEEAKNERELINKTAQDWFWSVAHKYHKTNQEMSVAAYAAYQLTVAASKFRSIIHEDSCIVDYMTGHAAMVACCLAHQSRNSFDLIEIIEDAMAA